MVRAGIFICLIATYGEEIAEQTRLDLNCAKSLFAVHSVPASCPAFDEGHSKQRPLHSRLHPLEQSACSPIWTCRHARPGDRTRLEEGHLHLFAGFQSLSVHLDENPAVGGRKCGGGA